MRSQPGSENFKLAITPGAASKGRAAQSGIYRGTSTHIGVEIQSLDPTHVSEVDCQTDDGNETSCGSATNPTCLSQCTYSPTVTDGVHRLTVSYRFYGGGEAETFSFHTFGEPPQTTLTLPLQPAENMNPPQSMEYPRFNLVGGANLDALPLTDQCMLTTPPSTTGQWGSCSLPRLELLGVYDLRARFVDIFGRADPEPPSYIFSPTPCRARVRGRMPTMADILRRGLRLGVMCVQPSSFEVDLNLPDWYVSYWQIPSPALGYVVGQSTRALQTMYLTVHMLRGIPRPLSRFLTTRGRVPLELLTLPHGSYGMTQLKSSNVRG